MTKPKNLKDILVERIGRQAEQEARYLAGEFLRAASAERELILAELEYEKWLAEACWESLD